MRKRRGFLYPLQGMPLMARRLYLIMFPSPPKSTKLGTKPSTHGNLGSFWIHTVAPSVPLTPRLDELRARCDGEEGAFNRAWLQKPGGGRKISFCRGGASGMAWAGVVEGLLLESAHWRQEQNACCCDCCRHHQNRFGVILGRGINSFSVGQQLCHLLT